MSDAPAAGSDAPFFVIGANGSGSTLLRLMLDSHERLAVPSETGFMRLVTAHRWVPFWDAGDRWAQRLELEPADVDRALADLYGGLLRRYAERHGKARWGEKTPFHLWHVDDIRRLFPDAVFVAIVRHPLGSVGSNVRRFDRKPARAIRHWLAATREIAAQAGRLGDRLCILRYEDLARHPEPVLRELLEWLGEPWSDRVLRHHEVHADDAPGAVEGGTRPDEAVDAARIGRWREWLEEPERAEVMRRTGPWAELLGYGATPEDEVEPLATSGTPVHLGSGPDLAVRLAARPDLDRTPPRRPWVDEPLLPLRARGRARALSRGRAAPDSTVRELFERMPPRLQRRVRRAMRNPRRRRR